MILPPTKMNESPGIIKLPQPKFESETSVEEALVKRRSIREYKNEPLTLEEISQLLWSTQGITDKDYGLRTAPSVEALYPLEIYIAVGNIEGLSAGIFKFRNCSYWGIK